LPYRRLLPWNFGLPSELVLVAAFYRRGALTPDALVPTGSGSCMRCGFTTGDVLPQVHQDVLLLAWADDHYVPANTSAGRLPGAPGCALGLTGRVGRARR
jgi:hypothetical protein